MQRQPLLVRYKQQANPLLSMNNYTPLLISMNDKNKQLKLLSQRKLALTAGNTLIKSFKHLKKKFKKWTCPLLRAETNHTCHQKPNPSRATVPLINDAKCYKDK
jgi:hypothetical protein